MRGGGQDEIDLHGLAARGPGRLCVRARLRAAARANLRSTISRQRSAVRQRQGARRPAGVCLLTRRRPVSGEESWMTASSRRKVVLVTGGAGFIGSHLI